MTIATALSLVMFSPNQQPYSCYHYHTCQTRLHPGRNTTKIFREKNNAIKCMGLDKMKSQLQSTAKSNTMVGTDSDTAVVNPALQNNFYKYILEMTRISPKARGFWARLLNQSSHRSLVYNFLTVHSGKCPPHLYFQPLLL